jgi:predicted aldo/keto reductase-like oxidoreductase
LEVSALGFGAIPIQRINEAQAEAVILRAIELGVTFIDTAASYGDSQRKIGRAIKGRRDGLVLASKSPERSRQGMLDDIDRSRREMGVDCVDLYQYHNIANQEIWREISAPGGAIDGLLEAKERGWIGHVGFTSHSLQMSLELVCDERFETIQFPFNLVTREPADDLIPLARKHNLGFIVMKPLCGGEYDDAELAFRFLNAYPDLLPIPGIERIDEIEQIVSVVEAGKVLEGDLLRRAREVADRLGKLFCRRCGYCLPCPQGIQVNMAMLWDGFVKRFPKDGLLQGPAPIVAKASECTRCGACESRCPYDLPIMDTIAANAKAANAALAQK